MSETTEYNDIEAETRVLARRIAFASQEPTNEGIMGLGMQIVTLSLEASPRVVDKSSPDYRRGIKDAFSGMYGSLMDGILPDREIVTQLGRLCNAQVLAKFAERSGIGLRTLAASVEARPTTIKDSIRHLQNISLIEPAIPASKADRIAWQLSPYGESTYERFMFSHLPKMVDEKDLLAGAGGIIRRRLQNSN